MSDNDLAVKFNSAWVELGKTLKKLNDIKEDSDISDKKTVEDAYIYNNNIKIDDHHSHICFNTRRKDYFSLYASDIGGNAVIVCTVGQYKDYAKMTELNKLNKEAVKPVYTQEMADNEELPPVGTKCMALFDSDLDEWVKVEVLSHRYNETGIGVASCVLPEKNFILGWFVDFKPIDTRTDEEKLIHNLVKSTSEIIKGHYGDEFTNDRGTPLSAVIIESILSKHQIKLK